MAYNPDDYLYWNKILRNLLINNINTLSNKTVGLLESGDLFASLVQNGRSNGSNATNVTLAQLANFSMFWSGTIQINALSSTIVWFGTKLSASPTTGSSVWFLMNSTTNQKRIVLFSTSAVVSDTVIADYEDSGWLPLTLQNGNRAVNGVASRCAYRKLNGVVYVRCDLETSNFNAAVAQLPVGYRPDSTLTLAIVRGTSSARGYIDVVGSINFGPISGSDTVTGMGVVAFPV